MALNLMYSDKELYQLMQYGIEGVNYTLDENGHRLPQDLEQYPEKMCIRDRCHGYYPDDLLGDRSWNIHRHETAL